MDENKLMLFDTNEISRAVILDRVNKFFSEYEIFPTRIYIPKTVENKWASLGSAEWDRLAGEIFVSGIRPIFGELPVFGKMLLIFWGSDKFGLEHAKEDIEKLRNLGCDVGMYED